MSADDESLAQFGQHLSRLTISEQADEPFGNLATLAVHADDELGKELSDVAPAMHLSTNYRYPDDGALEPTLDGRDLMSTQPIYSRIASAGSNRYEQILSTILGSKSGSKPCYAITYSSGVAAFNAILTHLLPKTVVMPTGSYHGLHGALELHRAISRGSVEKVTLQRPFDSPDSWTGIRLQPGDLVHIETPVNPTGEIVNLAFVAERVHAAGAVLVVDATLAPPPIQDPFELGADIVLHSGSKYFGGHSDMVCGIVAVRDKFMYRRLMSDRLLLGSTLGNIEIWLGIRSVRTLEMRVRQQSRNADRLVRWLIEKLETGTGPVAAAVEAVKHSIVQEAGAKASGSDVGWMKSQMTGGCSPVFALLMKSDVLARELPRKLKLFHHATSLGGVESLVEWRRMTDEHAPPTLVRVSVGIEGWEDLRDDFLQAFKTLAELKQ